MSKQLKAIYDSSANSANELVYKKSEPVYYANKHEFVNETPKVAILAIVIIVAFSVILEAEIGMQNSQIQLQRTMASLVRKLIPYINLEEFLVVLYVSPYIIGLMIAQIKWRKLQMMSILLSLAKKCMNVIWQSLLVKP